MGKEGNKLGLIIVLVVLVVIAGILMARYMGGQGTDPGQVPERYGEPPGAVPPGVLPGQ